MAIPTNFQGYTPSAGTTKSFPILGSATVGVWGNDVDGTQSAALFKVPVAPGLILFGTTAYTDAQLVPLLQDFIARVSGARGTGGAGGQPVETTKQASITATTTT